MPEHTVQLRKNAAFRWFLGGSSVSMLGSRLTTIAYPMLILFLHGSPVIAGLAVLAANAPSVLVYVPAGVLVDRWDDPKRTLLLAEAGRGIAVLVVVGLLLFHRAFIPLIIGMAIIEESFEVFAVLAERRYVRFMVKPTQASSAQVSIEAREHVAVLTGRALGGLLFGFGPVLPFLADALSFVVSVSALIGFKHDRKRPVRRLQEPEPNFAGEVLDGLRELLNNRFALDASLLSAGMTLISQALIIVFIAGAHGRHVSPLVIGSVLAASGIGGLLGALVGQRVRLPVNLSALKLQPIIWAAMLAALAISAQWQVPVMAVAMTVLGFAGAMGNVELDTYLMVKVPDKRLARVTSIEMLMDFTASAIGPALGGLLTELPGTGSAVWTLLVLTIPIIIFGLRMTVPAREASDMAQSSPDPPRAEIVVGLLTPHPERTRAGVG